MDFNVLSQYVTVLIIISASAERLGEIGKTVIGGLWYPIDQPDTDPKKEARRKFWILLLSLISCLLATLAMVSILSSLAALAEGNTSGQTPAPNPPQVPVLKTPHYLPVLPLSILALGGSSFWNSIQGYLSGVKNTAQAAGQAASPVLKQQAEAEAKRAEAARLATEEGDHSTRILELRAEAKRLDEEAATLINILSKK